MKFHLRQKPVLIPVLLTLGSFIPQLIQANTDCTQVTEIPQTECNDLLTLYHNTNGPNWSDSSTNNWNITNTPCHWTGVECSNGHVVKIVRARQNLNGTLPDFENFAYLKTLYLTSNPLSGQLPNFKGLPRLETLDLADNQLSGPIPNFDQLPVLRGLSLDFNQFTGVVPNFNHLPKLSHLDLSYNQLTGSIPNLNHTPYLRSLYLRGNQLTGGIPDFSHIPLLWTLNLSDNPLSGSIPDFNYLNNLRKLDLKNNQLTGTIPDFSHLPQLTYLFLTDNQLTGSIPDFQLPQLMQLHLTNNQLTGSIPNFSGIKNLSLFWATNNQLSGTIPNFTNVPKLRGLWLSHNQLSGSIPQFDNLPVLWSFRLSYNQLTGTIPDMSGFEILSAFSVDHNQLCSEIPASLAQIPRKSVVIDIAHNHLTATDPTLIAFLDQKDPGWEKTQTPCSNQQNCLIYGLHDGDLNNSQFFTINPTHDFEVQALGNVHREHDLESLAIHPQTKELYAGSGDDPGIDLKAGYIYRVNQSDGTLTSICHTDLGEISALSFHPHNHTLWAWADGKGLFIIEQNQIEEGVCRKIKIIASDAKVEDVVWHHDGSILYGASGKILYQYDNHTITKVCENFPSQVEALEMLADGSLLFALHKSSDTSIHSFDINTCSIQDSLPIYTPYTDIEGLTWLCP